MALVICCVLRTERMRRRISMRLGMSVESWPPIAERSLIRGDFLPFRQEALLELGEHRLELVAELALVVKRFLGGDLPQHFRTSVLQVSVQLRLEGAALLHRQVVQETVGAGEDDDNLFLDRRRLVL